MQCEYDKCDNKLTGRKKRFCCDKCRMAQSRTAKSNKPEQIKVEQPKANKVEQGVRPKLDLTRKMYNDVMDEITKPKPHGCNMSVTVVGKDQPEPIIAFGNDVTSVTLVEALAGVTPVDWARTNADVVSLTKDQLYSAIRSYPQDTWVGSPEYVELMRRLKIMSIKQLEDGGYWIPCWKHTEAA